MERLGDLRELFTAPPPHTHTDTHTSIQISRERLLISAVPDRLFLFAHLSQRFPSFRIFQRLREALWKRVEKHAPAVCVADT